MISLRFLNHNYNYCVIIVNVSLTYSVNGTKIHYLNKNVCTMFLLSPLWLLKHK